MSSHSLTLGHFKEQLRKKGNYRCVHRHSGVAHPLMWEHLARLAHSEQPAAIPLAKFTLLNFARCVRDLWVCARAQLGPGLCCLCVCV